MGDRKTIRHGIIGIPLGDIAGIGPEIVAMALAQPALYDIARPLVIGETGALTSALRVANWIWPFGSWTIPPRASTDPARSTWWIWLTWTPTE